MAGETRMSTIQAIQTATINCAEMLGLSDRGELKEGLLADIIAVDKIKICHFDNSLSYSTGFL